MFKVRYAKAAMKFLKKHPNLLNHIIEVFRKIANDIKEIKNYDIKKLQGMSDTYRLRKGSYRVIFQIKNKELVIIIIDANNRGDVYK